MKAFRTLLILLAGLAAASFGQPCSSNNATDVVYHFPNVANLGTLERRIGDRPGAVALDRISSRRHKVAAAMGVVKLSESENRGVYFAPGLALIRRPELMDAISPDNIQGFLFSFTSTGDSEDALADGLVAKISHLKNLRLLKLSRCDVSDLGAKGIHDLPQLKTLDLSYSLISNKSVPVIGKLTGLEELILNNVDLAKSDFSHLGGLPKLSALYLRNSQVSDAMVNALKPAKSLSVLDLTNNTAITDASLPALALLPNLKTVSFSGTSVNVRSLIKLSRVTSVVVSRRELKGASLAVLCKTIPNLVLDIRDKQGGLGNSPGAEEMHLFAPTRF